MGGGVSIRVTSYTGFSPCIYPASGPALSLLSHTVTVTQFKASFPNTSQKLRTFLWVEVWPQINTVCQRSYAKHQSSGLHVYPHLHVAERGVTTHCWSSLHCLHAGWPCSQLLQILLNANWRSWSFPRGCSLSAEFCNPHLGGGKQEKKKFVFHSDLKILRKPLFGSSCLGAGAWQQ